jgi:hypothetical protein
MAVVGILRIFSGAVVVGIVSLSLWSAPTRMATADSSALYGGDPAVCLPCTLSVCAGAIVQCPTVCGSRTYSYATGTQQGGGKYLFATIGSDPAPAPNPCGTAQPVCATIFNSYEDLTCQPGTLP